MGCNCGGAQRSSGSRAQSPGEATRGPQAPGYAWTGPQKRAEQAEPTPAKN